MIPRPWALFAIAIPCLIWVSASSAQNASSNGQAAQATAPSAPSDSSAPKSPQTPKKIWTNDDIADLRANSTISTVGDQKNVTRRTNTWRPSSDDLVRSYRDQIDQLQARVAGIDKQIADLRGALNGKAVDSTRKYEPLGGKIGDWNSQIDQLQKNRQDLLRQIDALETRLRQSNP